MTDVRREQFGVLDDGREVDRFELRDGDIQATVLSWGATLASLVMPDRTGDRADVVLGFDELTGYAGAHPYLGATVGRFANRLARGRFTLDGVEHVVPANDGANALHGGPVGFDRAVWAAEVLPDAGAVRFTHSSPDGDMGFPGRLDVTVTYTLDGSTLRWDYEASTDQPTVLNLTNHAYLNLAGHGTAEHHELVVDASRFVSVDGEGIPTGDLLPVDGTPLDFRTVKPLGRDLRVASPHVVRAKGYDHSFVLDRESGAPPSRAAHVHDPDSGRTVEVWTDQPGVQLYSGNFLDATLVGRGGVVYRQGDAVCLETQHLPDSPNHDGFPSTVLRPGEHFRSTTWWSLSAS